MHDRVGRERRPRPAARMRPAPPTCRSRCLRSSRRTATALRSARRPALGSGCFGVGRRRLGLGRRLLRPRAPRAPRLGLGLGVPRRSALRRLGLGLGGAAPGSASACLGAGLGRLGLASGVKTSSDRPRSGTSPTRRSPARPPARPARARGVGRTWSSTRLRLSERRRRSSSISRIFTFTVVARARRPRAGSRRGAAQARRCGRAPRRPP